MKMADYIRDYIKDNGLKINFIAKKSGFSEKKLYRIVNGQKQISVEEYERICRDGLSLDPGYFFKQKFLDAKK